MGNERNPMHLVWTSLDCPEEKTCTVFFFSTFGKLLTIQTIPLWWFKGIDSVKHFMTYE